jgi:hypothetical protein
MARKQTTKREQIAPGEEGQKAGNFAVQQGTTEDRQVGYGNPPKEYRFKPGESGNPHGQPRHRTNLWTYFTKYMGMTDAQIGRLNKDKLTQSQQVALNIVEKIKAGEKVGSTAFARYIVDREEGKAAEHLILDNSADLSHEQCEKLRMLLKESHRTSAAHAG